MSDTWRTKPTDRFILRWMKINVSARITPHLVGISFLTPGMLTVCSTVVGVGAGILFGLGYACTGGVLALVSQALDGVDGQFARLTKQESPEGAFLDSTLDRYSDGALVLGVIKYSLDYSGWDHNVVFALGAAAVIGSGLISYTSARAASLGLPEEKPTLASKGTRTVVAALSGVFSLLYAGLPGVALVYLAVHTNAVALGRIWRVVRSADHGTART